MTLNLTKAYTPTANQVSNSTDYNTDVAALFNAFSGLEAQTSTLGGLTITPSANGTTKFKITNAAGTELWSADTTNSAMKLKATGKLYLDGGGDTYLTEGSANDVSLYVGGAVAFSASTTFVSCGGGLHFKIASGQRMYFDGGSSTNYAISDTSMGSSTGNLYIGNETITTSSDVRLKTNIEDTKIDALRLVNELRVVDFDWNDKVSEHDSRKQRGRYTGMLAQDMIDIVPWVINHQGAKDCDKCKAGQECDEHKLPWIVQYEYLVPVLIKAVQDLQAKVKKLEAFL